MKINTEMLLAGRPGPSPVVKVKVLEVIGGFAKVLWDSEMLEVPTHKLFTC